MELIPSFILIFVCIGIILAVLDEFAFITLVKVILACTFLLIWMLGMVKIAEKISIF